MGRMQQWSQSYSKRKKERVIQVTETLTPNKHSYFQFDRNRSCPHWPGNCMFACCRNSQQYNQCK